MYMYVCCSTDRLQGAMIGVIALFAGFAIEAVVVVTVVLAANLRKVPTCLLSQVTYKCMVSSGSRGGRREV